MTLWREITVKSEFVEPLAKMVGSVILFNKGHYGVSGIEFDPICNGLLVRVRIQLMPIEGEFPESIIQEANLQEEVRAIKSLMNTPAIEASSHGKE